MANKKLMGSPSEQEARFQKKIERSVATCELSPTETDKVLDAMLTSKARSRDRH